MSLVVRKDQMHGQGSSHSSPPAGHLGSAQLEETALPAARRYPEPPCLRQPPPVPSAHFCHHLSPEQSQGHFGALSYIHAGEHEYMFASGNLRHQWPGCSLCGGSRVLPGLGVPHWAAGSQLEGRLCWGFLARALPQMQCPRSARSVRLVYGDTWMFFCEAPRYPLP